MSTIYYIIQEVQTLQEYIDGIQDGIYYLTCLIGNISPTVAEFSDQSTSNFYYLYPVVDKDNSNNDPDHTISAASNKMLGQVDVNDTLNSITKKQLSILEIIKLVMASLVQPGLVELQLSLLRETTIKVELLVSLLILKDLDMDLVLVPHFIMSL